MQRDPLRGHLFENLVVLEFLKNRFEKAERSNLSYFRDSNHNEVDLIVPAGSDNWAVEIKSSQTIASDFFKGLEYFASLGSGRRVKKALVYGGNQNQTRSSAHIVAWNRINTLFDTMSNRVTRKQRHISDIN